MSRILDLNLHTRHYSSSLNFEGFSAGTLRARSEQKTFNYPEYRYVETFTLVFLKGGGFMGPLIVRLAASKL
jgi:hypothetical protein